MLQRDPQRSDASQNDHKSKGYPSNTSEAAFTMQKADKGDLRRLKAPCAAAFEIDFQKSDFPALILTRRDKRESYLIVLQQNNV